LFFRALLLANLVPAICCFYISALVLLDDGIGRDLISNLFAFSPILLPLWLAFGALLYDRVWRTAGIVVLILPLALTSWALIPYLVSR
jgi:hypothetical protein